MSRSLHAILTRRERPIIDILFRRGRATAAEVMAEQEAMAALLGGEASKLSHEQLERIAEMIEKARQGGSR